MPRAKSLDRAIAAVPGNRKVTSARGLARYAVDGRVPSVAVFPNTVVEMAGLLAAADAEDKAVVPWGGGTSMGLGNLAARVDLVIGASRLNRILEYEPADLTVIVEGGTKLSVLQSELARNGQFLPLDPPLAEKATIGGILASNASGPRRAFFGTARDRLIGIRVVHPDGVATRGGGKVVKNVAGYDMNKLYTGSLGTLGIIVEAAFKVAPKFKEERSILMAVPSLDVAARLALDIPGTGVEPLALELLDAGTLGALGPKVSGLEGDGGYALALELGGTAAAIARQEKEVRALAEKSEVEVKGVLGGQDSSELWRQTRDLGRDGHRPAAMIVKTTTLASDVASLVDGLSLLGGEEGIPFATASNVINGVTYSYWWPESGAVNGLKGIVDALRAQASGLNGHCVVEVCPIELKAEIDVWGISGPQTLLMKSIKEQFDPRGTLNPGRFVDGI